MKYLVHCDLSDHDYSTNYTLAGIFDSKEECIDFMKKYNAKVDAFEVVNKDLIEKAAYDPINDPKYADYTIRISKDIVGWDYEKLKKNPEIDEETDKLAEKRQNYIKELEKAAAKDGIMQEDNSDKFFKFDIVNADQYIDKFDGKPICLSHYSE